MTSDPAYYNPVADAALAAQRAKVARLTATGDVLCALAVRLDVLAGVWADDPNMKDAADRLRFALDTPGLTQTTQAIADWWEARQ